MVPIAGVRDFKYRHEFAAIDRRVSLPNDLEVSQMTTQFNVASGAGTMSAEEFVTGGPMTEEILPFTVGVAHNEKQLERAVSLRQSAYARHVPEFAAKLKKPEVADSDPGSIVLFAESKLDGSVIGTMRIQTNRYGNLGIEESIELPDWLQGATLAEATRLGVAEGREGRLVKTVLFKAYFLYCQRALVDWMVITARRPLDRQYEALLFKDVFAPGEYIPMHHVGGIAHRVMAFHIPTAEMHWTAANHPLYDFMCRTWHPDILLDVAAVVAPAHFVPMGKSASGNTIAMPL